MAKERPRFIAVNAVAIPVKLKFETKRGETVYIKALKIVSKTARIRSKKK